MSCDSKSPRSAEDMSKQTASLEEEMTKMAAGMEGGVYEWIVAYDEIKHFLEPSFLKTSHTVIFPHPPPCSCLGAGCAGPWGRHAETRRAITGQNHGAGVWDQRTWGRFGSVWIQGRRECGYRRQALAKHAKETRSVWHPLSFACHVRRGMRRAAPT